MSVLSTIQQYRFKVIRIYLTALRLMLEKPWLIGIFLKNFSFNGFRMAVNRAVDLGKRELGLAGGTAKSPRPEKLDANKIKEAIASFQQTPMVSIIMPVHDAETRWLEAAVDSVRRQFYESWQLLVVDDGSKRSETREFIDKLDDPKIIARRLGSNQGISRASNAALETASGEYVTFLDHDDELAPNALFEVVKAINETGADFIYSDEDFIDPKRGLGNPHFKPDYSPDLLFSHNYITHLCAIKTSIVNDVGGFNPDMDGAQDYDLFLKALEKTDNVHHISKILYHWRVHDKSTSGGSGTKKYADDAGKRALAAALRRREIRGEVFSDGPRFHYHVKRDILGDPLVSIIIPFKDQAKHLRKCVRSIINKTAYPNWEILAIDNGSVESKTSKIKEKLKSLDPRVKFATHDVPFNFSEIMNFGVSEAKGEHVLLLNNDVEVISEEWLGALLEHSQRPEVGVVGGTLYYPNNSVQHAGVIIGIRGVAGHANKGRIRGEHGYFNRLRATQNVTAVTGACMMVKKALFEEMGGLDQINLKIAFNDIDFCLRLREKGYLNVFNPKCELYHYESLSRGYEDTDEKVERFEQECAYLKKRHKRALRAGDPYYNPNFSLESEHLTYSLR